MARLLKCYGEDCVQTGKKWEKDQLVKYKNKNFCLSCAAKEKKNDEDRTLLYKLISELYEIPFPNGLMLRQIKQFNQERKYTYENIRKALLYGKHVRNMSFHPKYGLGIVPYIIDEAVAYHDDQVRKAKAMEGKTVSSERNVVKKKFIAVDRDAKIKDKMINLEDIEL
jgi:hypothetical protein